jgi:4-methylaminobutanoate oxidase (formaldehyde-forming)
MGFARAHRISYVGELGWELYVPTDMAKHVFDNIIQNGSDKGLQLCGMHVLDSCRLEKAYRHFGHDITDEDHVLEAGLGFCVKLNKPMAKFGHFIGRDAVLAKKDRGIERRLLQFKLRDSMPLLYHNETIYRDGTSVGRITSGGFGHYLGASVGLGYVPCQREETVEQIMNSDYEIDIAGTRVKAEASIRPFYDPLSERVKL